MRASSSPQSTGTSRYTPIQPRPPTYGGRKKRSGSASTSVSWTPSAAAIQTARRSSWCRSAEVTKTRLPTNQVASPWLSRSMTSGSATQIARIRRTGRGVVGGHRPVASGSRVLRVASTGSGHELAAADRGAQDDRRRDEHDILDDVLALERRARTGRSSTSRPGTGTSGVIVPEHLDEEQEQRHPHPATEEQAHTDGHLPDGQDRQRDRGGMTPSVSASIVRAARSSAGSTPGNSLSAPNQKNTMPRAKRRRVRPWSAIHSVMRRSSRSNQRGGLDHQRSLYHGWGPRPRAADLALAPRHERVERLRDGRVQRRRHRLGQEPLPDAVRPLGRGVRAVRLPRLEVPPVGHHRLVERGLEALERVGRAEEVAARPDVDHRVEPERGLVDDHRLEDLARSSAGSRHRR